MSLNSIWNAYYYYGYFLLLLLCFKIVEMIGGYVAGSLAIMTDAAHLVTDSLTFFIGAFAIAWSNKKADEKMSFGYKRIEVFGAVISIIGIWILTLFILYFAIQRLLHIDDFEIDTNTMLAVSILGIMVNIVYFYKQLKFLFELLFYLTFTMFFIPI